MPVTTLMRPAEAAWIGRALAKLPIDAISPLVNLGSCDALHRSKERADIWDPLDARGVRTIHVDCKTGPGIDISGDIYRAETQDAIRAFVPRAILCCNMLEHVADPHGLAQIIMALGGETLIISVPNSYPYHRDPIDTMFRPDLAALSKLFPGFVAAEGEIVRDLTSWQTTRQYHSLGWATLYYAGAMAAATVEILRGRNALKARHPDILWLFRRYKVACTVFTRTGSART